MTKTFNQCSTAESYADLNVATSDGDLLAWVAEHGSVAVSYIKRAETEPGNDVRDCDTLADKIQAGHWVWLCDQWRDWRADQDESDQHKADIEKTDESLRRWFCWQARP